MNGLRRLLLACALSLLTPALAEAQERGVIAGQVVGDRGQPLQGAQVQVQGTELRTVTGVEGRFRIPNVPAGPRVVTATLLGFGAGTQTVTVGSGAEAQVTFRLAPSALALDALVVTGTAGRQERRAQPAVVATISAADVVETQPVTSVADILSSRTPGVSMNQASGTAGTGQRIRIRGAASINLSNEPLVFIDGVRADARNQELLGVGGQVTSRLNDINPEDIESIEVVKGPAAATLYGADASAGVIQIITKRGRAGTGRFTQSITTEYHTIDPNFTPPTNFGACTAADVTNPQRALCSGQPVGTIISDNPLVRSGTFRDGTFRSLGWTGRGGGENYGYFLSLGTDDEEGTLPNNEYNRRTGRVNFDFIPSPKWRIEAGFGLMRSETALPINDNQIYGFMGNGMLGTPRSRGIPVVDGWYGRSARAVTNITSEQVVVRSTPTLQVNFSPVSWFTNRLTVGGDLSRIEATQLYPRNDSTWFAGDLNLGQVSEVRQNSDRYTIDYLGNIRSGFLEDRVSSDLSFGAQLIATRMDQLDATGTGLATNEARNISAAAQRSSTGSYSEERQIGFLGQWQLGWEDRFFLQLGARIDQNSAFGNEADAFFLPKVGASWVVSEEGFWQPVAPVVNSLRLRAAYGTTGRSPTAGAALETYNPRPYALSGTAQRPGVIPLNPGNPGLKPERGTEFEVGLDAGFLDGRAGLELTYFDKTTTDVLLLRPLAGSSGFTENPYVNIGEVNNSGFELALNARLVDARNFAWDTRLAMNTLSNELVSLGGVAPFGSLNRFEEGMQLGAFVSPRIIRVGTSEAACPQPASPTAARRTECAIVTSPSELEFVGNFLPTNEGSFTSTFTLFRNLSVTGLIDWKRDFYIYNNTAQFRDRQLGNSERWVKRADLSAEERARFFGPFFTEEGASVAAGSVYDAYLEDGSFVRFRELAATVSLPSQVASRFGASGASFTLGGRNLALWTDYSGPDPDVISGQRDGQWNRSDFLTIPNAKRLTARLNFQF